MASMKMRIMRPKSVLLDANVIIEAYELGVWDVLISKIEIYVPSIVAHDEALFFKGEIGTIPENINLPELTRMNKIIELSASIEEISGLRRIFDDLFLSNIHQGEMEALAILFFQKNTDILFCTADAMPIKGMAMMQLSEKGISFENLLKAIGIQKKLKHQFTEKWFNQKKTEGNQNLITGSGLKDEYRAGII